MEINLELIKKLKNETGAAIADCKKALEDTNGNYKKAFKSLKKKQSRQILTAKDKKRLYKLKKGFLVEYEVVVKNPQKIITPHLCCCCLKKTNSQRKFVYQESTGSTLETHSLKIPICSTCIAHETLSRFLGFLVFLASFYAIIGIIYTCSEVIELIKGSPQGKVIHLLNNLGRTIITIVIIFGYFKIKKLIRDRYLKKYKGHASLKHNVSFYPRKTNQYKFIFKNKKFAELFAELNHVKFMEIK